MLVKKRWHRRVVFGVVFPALIYLVAHLTVLDRSRPSPLAALGIDPTTFDVDTISPRLAQQLGLRSKRPATEVVVVVVSGTFCPANRVEGFQKAVSSVAPVVKARFSNRPEVITRMVGVALDNDAKAGADYLLRLAPFDEIVSGGSWLNTATEKLLWGSYALEVTIPQIVVLIRKVTWTEGSTAVIEEERVLETVVGADRIIEWVEDGAPIREQASRPSFN